MKKISFGFIIILLLLAEKAGAQCTVNLSSAIGTDAQTVCVNIPIVNITYETTGANGASFTGLPAGVTGVWLADVVTISGTPVQSGTFNYSVKLSGCGSLSVDGIINVTANNTITRTSSAGTDSQTICAGASIQNITYSTTGAGGANFSGLPSGVTGLWAGNIVTISGTPTVAAGSTFNYTITLTGGCGNITANGTIRISANNTIALSSAAGSDNQTRCTGQAIAPITYSTTVATGASFSGLPPGVSGSWSNNTATITGSPTSSSGSPYNYTVTTTGGCGSASENGVITVTPGSTINLTSAGSTTNQTVCVNTAITNITYTTTGATGATFSGLPAGVTGSFSSNSVTISGSPSASGSFNYTVTLTGGCGSPTANGTINVTSGSTITLSSGAGTNNQTVCTGTSITNITFATTGATGATFSGLPPGVTGVWNANVVTISGAPSTSAGSPFNYTVNLTGGCGTASAGGTITVASGNTITLSSGAGSNSQTRCLGQAITNITYNTTGATGATFSGLPAGVTGVWNANVVTISGAPTSASGSPFNYVVNLTGGCGTVSANGTITVTVGNTIALSSAVGTNSQSFCIGTALTTITYATTGATGATFTGLPAGVTGIWSSNVVTISGIPSAAGNFNYSVNLTGGCGTVSAPGTINVNSLPVATLTSSEPDNTICSGTSVTFTAGGGGAGANYNFFVANVSRQNGLSATFITNTLTNGQRVRVVVTNTNTCTSTNTAEIQMIVNAPPFISAPGSLTCSADLTTYSFSVVSSGTVTSSAGTVTSTGSNNWLIAAIPSGVATTVRATDAGGCINTLEVAAPNCACPTVLAPVSGGDKTYCQSGIIPAINATVLSGETVDWYSASTGGTLLRAGSLTYTPLAPGTYYAVARNITTLCVSSTRTAVTVSVIPAPVAVLTSSDADNSFCTGTSVVFTAGGGTNYNFMIGGVSVQNGLQQTYTTATLANNDIVSVTVTNTEGCSATSTGITNTVHPLPVPVLTSSDADNSFCTGTAITFTASGGTNFNFRVGGLTVQNGTSPTYVTNALTNGQVVDVIVTNNNTCSATSAPITNSVFAIPVITAGTGGNNCGLSFHLNGTLSVGTGTWTKESGPGNVTFTPNANTETALVSVTAFGSYTFRWTVLSGTCEASETVTILFIQQSAANAGTGGNECDKDFIFNALPITSGVGTWTKINGPGNAVFTPDSHQPNATVTVDQGGTYDFAWTVVNSTCTSSDIIRVGFHDPPPVFAGNDTTMCKGTGIQLRATGTGTVSWTPVEHVSNPSIINPVVNPLLTTTYVVQIIDQFGCRNSDNIIVEVLNKPVADAGPDQTIVAASTANMDASPPGASEAGYWSVAAGSGIFSDSTYAKTSVKDLSMGENKMVWTLSNAICPISHDTANIYVNDFVIPTLITPNMDGRNDYFVLSGLSAAGKTELLVFDRRGIKVYSNADYDNSWDGVDNNNKPLPEDTYFYALKTESGRILKGYIVIKR